MADASLIQDPPEGAVFILRDRMRPNPSQPREHFDMEELRELAASIKEIGQITPVELRPLPDGDEKDYEITDGERRWLACGLAGRDRLLAWINPVAEGDETFIRSVAANFGRVGHTPLEIARAIKRIMASERVRACPNKTEQMAMVARIFARSPTWVHHHLSVLNLHDGVLDLMDPSIEKSRRIGFSIAVFLNTIPDREVQLEIARQVSEKGLTLNQARALARKKAREAGLTAGKRARRPSDHYRSLSRFLRSFTINAEEVLDMPVSSFEQIFRRRSVKQQLKLLERIDKAIDQLTEVRQALGRAHQRTVESLD